MVSKSGSSSTRCRKPTNRRALTLLHKFRRNKDGVTAIEFALIALPFFAVMFAVIELGLIFFAEMMIDNGMNKAARLIRTGQAQGMSQTEFKEVMCDDVFLIKNCEADVALDVRSFDDFGDINLPNMVENGEPVGNTAYNPGTRKQVVVVRATYAWNLFIPNITNLGNQGSADKYFLSTSATFRNEPF